MDLVSKNGVMNTIVACMPLLQISPKYFDDILTQLYMIVAWRRPPIDTNCELTRVASSCFSETYH